MNALICQTGLQKFLAWRRTASLEELCEMHAVTTRLVRFILDDRQLEHHYTLLGALGEEIDNRLAGSAEQLGPTPTPWRDARKVQPDADEEVLTVHCLEAVYTIATFEPSEFGDADGVWLDFMHRQAVPVTHWMPLVGILEPPTEESAP